MNDLDIKQITLDKMRLSYGITLNDASFEKRALEDLPCAISYSFYAYIYGKQKQPIIKYYASWWDELRTKILPKWWINRRPSKIRVHEFEVYYPTLNLNGGEHEAVIRYIESVKLKED